jgi:hypothetical protein
MFAQCSVWYNLTKKESNYYTPDEIVLLKETTSAAGFSYGYDPDLDLDYIYIAGNYSDKELAAKEKAQRDILSSYETERVTAFYEKIFRLKSIIEWNMNYYGKNEKWEERTLIKKYILPDTVKFVEILEKNLLMINRDYRNIIEERKKKISSNVDKELS